MNAEVNNVERKGNLESKNPSGCVSLNDLSSKNTPADIFVGLVKCLDKSDYKKASELYLAALVYGRFDSKRVKDKTAHQAIAALRLNNLGNLNKDKIEKFNLALKDARKNMSSICSSLKQLGKPDYYPNYMIKHGMDAFNDNKSKGYLVSNFDPRKEWKDVLNNYVKCPI